MTEGEKVINNKFSVSLPQFRFAQQLPRQREPVSDSRKGCPYGRGKIKNEKIIMEKCGCFARNRNYNEQCRAGACSRRYLYMKLSEKFRSLPEGYVPQCGKMSRSDKRDGLPSGAVERSETEGVKIGYIKPCENSPSHFFCEKTTALPSCGARFC